MLNINEVSTPSVSVSCLQLNEQSYARATCLLSLLSYPHPRYTVVFLFKLYLMCCFRTASAPTPTPELCPLLLLCHASQMSFTFSLYPSHPPPSASLVLCPLSVPSPPDVHGSQDSPPLDSRCCYYYTCTTHRPSFLPLRSASPAAQVLPSHPYLILSQPLSPCLLLLSSNFFVFHCSESPVTLLLTLETIFKLHFYLQLFLLCFLPSFLKSKNKLYFR